MDLIYTKPRTSALAHLHAVAFRTVQSAELKDTAQTSFARAYGACTRKGDAG